MIALGIALVLSLLVFGLTRRISATVLSFALLWWLSYTGLPALSWGFYGLPLLLLVASLIAFGFSLSDADRGIRSAGPSIAAVVLSGFLLTVVPFVSTTAIGRTDDYRALLGTVDTLTNSPDLLPFDPTQVRGVDHDLARRLAEKKLGEQSALGSQVDIGDLTVQAFRGQLYWVGPLNHSGFFKWLNNSEGTPGYVMVSWTNPSDVRLVTELEDGSPIRLKYNHGGFFGDDLERYVYNKGYATKGLTDFTFEIDDTGRPFFVMTRYVNKIGFGGSDAVGIAVLDAQTGDIREYTPETAPAWVDRIQPEYFVTQQIRDWGQYPHGWWNPSDRDKTMPTDGMALAYGNDGRSYYYTGITSVGADEGTVGYILVDTRTKKSRFYRQSGATEQAAMSAAQQALPEKGYTPMFPVPASIGGVWTYVIPLKNGEGLVAAIALVSVEDYQIIGVAEDARGAVREYRRRLANRGSHLAMDTQSSRTQASGKVVRLAQDNRDGDTYYYLMIEGQEGLAFVGGSGVSVELPFTREGDVVTIGYDHTGNGVVDIMDFDNAGLAFTKSAPQQKVDEAAEQVRTENLVASEAKNAEAHWEQLSDAEKARLLGTLKSDEPTDETR